MKWLTILLSIFVFAFCFVNCRGGEGIPTLTPYPTKYQINIYPEDAGTLPDIAGRTSFVVSVESLTGHRVPEDIKMKAKNGEIIGILDYPEPITSIYSEIKAFVVIANVEPQFELEVEVNPLNKRTFHFNVNVVPACRWRDVPSEIYYTYATPPSWKLQSLVRYAINFWALFGVKFTEIPREVMAPPKPSVIIYDGGLRTKADIHCEICKIFVKTEGGDLKRGAAHVFGHSLGLLHSPPKERMALMGVESYDELKDIDFNPPECMGINEPPRFHWYINPSRLAPRIQPY